MSAARRRARKKWIDDRIMNIRFGDGRTLAGDLDPGSGILRCWCRRQRSVSATGVHVALEDGWGMASGAGRRSAVPGTTGSTCIGHTMGNLRREQGGPYLISSKHSNCAPAHQWIRSCRVEGNSTVDEEQRK